jgi:hypothetical protein
MRSKILVMSAAALLAGTMMAAGQGMQHQGSGAAGARDNGAGAAGQMQDKEKSGAAQRSESPANKGAPGQAQRESSPSKTTGEAQRDNSKSSGQSKSNGQAQRESTPPKTTGQAPRDEENRNQAQDRDKNQNRAQGQKQRDQERTQGQTQRDRDQDRVQGQNQRDRDQNRAQGQNERDQNRTLGQGAASSSGSVNLTTEQRTKVRQTVLTSSAPRVEHVDFAVNVGTVVPRTVHIVEVPTTLVEIHPQWRGYRYFVYNDEIIIVEPDTLKIVAIVTV